MANTSVFTGADGSLTLGPGVGPEGEVADAIIKEFDILTVGRVQNVRVEVTSEVHPFHEIGQRYATQLRAGNVNVRGVIGRAYVNGALLKLLLGVAANSRPAASWNQPTFNITLLLENSASPGVQNTLTLHDVKLTTWAVGIPEDDFVLESVAFQALYISVEDEA